MAALDGPSVPPAHSTGKKRAHTVATLAAALEQTNATLERMKAENAQLREQHSRVVQRLESLDRKSLVPCSLRGSACGLFVILSSWCGRWPH